MGPKIRLLRETLLDVWQGVPVGTRVIYTPVLGRPDIGAIEAETTIEEPWMLGGEPGGEPVVRVSGRGLVALLALRRAPARGA